MRRVLDRGVDCATRRQATPQARSGEAREVLAVHAGARRARLPRPVGRRPVDPGPARQRLEPAQPDVPERVQDLRQVGRRAGLRRRHSAAWRDRSDGRQRTRPADPAATAGRAASPSSAEAAVAELSTKRIVLVAVARERVGRCGGSRRRGRSSRHEQDHEQRFLVGRLRVGRHGSGRAHQLAVDRAGRRVDQLPRFVRHRRTRRRNARSRSRRRSSSSPKRSKQSRPTRPPSPTRPPPTCKPSPRLRTVPRRPPRPRAPTRGTRHATARGGQVVRRRAIKTRRRSARIARNSPKRSNRFPPRSSTRYATATKTGRRSSPILRS